MSRPRSATFASTGWIAPPSRRRSAWERRRRRSIDLTQTIPVERDGSASAPAAARCPVPGSGAQPGGAILLLYDVTELARVDEMRSELVAVASHELQTPLTTLRMTL